MATKKKSSPGVDELRKNRMMAHLIDSLESGENIGHYGRLVFAMVGHHFLGEDELVSYLQNDPDCDEAKARALCAQVTARDYNPPRRERILEWQAQQDFPICPDGDPDGCNIYRDLKFPDDVYQHIEQYYEEKAETATSES